MILGVVPVYLYSYIYIKTFSEILTFTAPFCIRRLLFQFNTFQYSLQAQRVFMVFTNPANSLHWPVTTPIANMKQLNTPTEFNLQMKMKFTLKRLAALAHHSYTVPSPGQASARYFPQPYILYIYTIVRQSHKVCYTASYIHLHNAVCIIDSTLPYHIKNSTMYLHSWPS